MIRHGRRRRVRSARLALASLPALLPALASPAPADPFLPSAAQAVRLVRDHRTDGHVTVAQTLAYAARVRAGVFAVAPVRAERRAGEPFVRVRLCYRLGAAPPECGIDYRVTADPPHVELADRYGGLGRELQVGRERFVQALDRELGLRQDPPARALRDIVEPFDPYDRR